MVRSLSLAIMLFLALPLCMHAQQTAPDTLGLLRKQIDSLDRKAMELFGARMKVAGEIGEYKKAHNLPTLQPARFEELLHRNIALGKTYGLSETFIRELMEAVHRESLVRQQ